MNAYIVMEYDSINCKSNLPSELGNQFVHIPSDLKSLKIISYKFQLLNNN